MSRAFADERTLALLDFERIREMLAGETTSHGAGRRMRALEPSTTFAQVRADQQATTEMRRLLQDAPFSLARTVDVEPALDRAARGGVLGAEELHEVARALGAAHAALRRVRAAEAPELERRTAGAPVLDALVTAIDDAIGERAEVLDRASPELARLRRAIARGLEDARESATRFARAAANATALQDTIVTMRDGRFVVPVKAEHAGSIAGVVHDTSSSGQTLFVEPLAILEANNALRRLRIEEEREVARILAALSGRVGASAEGAGDAIAALVEIDEFLARARLADRMNAIAPELREAPGLELVRARHPLLGDRAVPQSLVLGGTTRVIVISGPNMGGKTVALKLAGLFVAMAACGLHLPAEPGTGIGAFDRLVCELGDEQSIAEHASTFSAHLSRLRAIVDDAGDRTLALVDEIASGTEPAAGAALALAILERFLERGTQAIVTTHATALKLFAHETPGVVNASVRFDAATQTPTYELDIGVPGGSLAFSLARTIGLDEVIVERAEALVSSGERDYERALGELNALSAAAASDRDELRRERDHIATLQANLRRRTESLERERRAFAARAEERLGRVVREFAANLAERSGSARGRVTPGQASLLARTLGDVHRELGLAPPAQAKGPAPTLAVGDRVRVPDFGGEGIVAEDYGDNVLVELGSMKSVVAKNRIERLGPAVKRDGAQRAGTALLEAATTVRPELDVRGKRFAEAEPLVEAWIEEARLAGAGALRLIHGKGTGMLGRGLQERVRTIAGVRGVRYGEASEGGSGVTIFEVE